MQRFCTRCGARNAADAAFCESCGNPMPARPAEVPAAERFSPPPAPPGKSGKTALLWGGAIFILLILGLAVGLAWVHFSKPVFAPEQLSEAIRRHLDSSLQIAEPYVCLSNLPYQRPELQIRSEDRKMGDWLDLLVEGGLYEVPREEVIDRGLFGMQTLHVYARTESGAAAVRGNRLCFADGIEFVRLDGYVPPPEIKPGVTATARFVYRYRNPQEWVKDPRAAQLMPARFSQAEWPAGVELRRGEQDWQVVSLIHADQAGQAIQQAQAASAAENRPSAMGGFSDWLKKLFSGVGSSGNPLIGRWRVDVGGLENLAGMAGILGGDRDVQSKMLMSIEFTADTMRLMGEDIPVSYSVKSGEVIVEPKKAGKALLGGGDSLSFKVQDDEHIALDLMFVEIPYRRER